MRDSDGAAAHLPRRRMLGGIAAAGAVAATASGLSAGFGGAYERAANRGERVRLTTFGAGTPTLVVIDMQSVFGNPTSGWFTPKFADASAVVQRLLPAFGERVVFTRFVAPTQPEGEWVTFYQAWPWALVADTDPIYDLVPPFAGCVHPTVTETTFGKWGAGLRQALGDSGEMVLTGVATDCCVLATALAGADAGVRVQVVADGCAGSTEANHRRALDAMAGWAPPLIEITDSATVLTELR